MLHWYLNVFPLTCNLHVHAHAGTSESGAKDQNFNPDILLHPTTISVSACCVPLLLPQLHVRVYRRAVLLSPVSCGRWINPPKRWHFSWNIGNPQYGCYYTNACMSMRRMHRGRYMQVATHRHELGPHADRHYSEMISLSNRDADINELIPCDCTEQ